MKNIIHTAEYLPLQLREIREYQEICHSIDEEFELILTRINKIQRNAHAIDADLDGIKYFENMYILSVGANDEIEQRRARVIAYENGETPYTKISLRKKLDAVLGQGNYTIEFMGGSVKILLELNVKYMQNDVWDILDKWIPANMGFGVELNYNTHAKIKEYGYTHRQLAEMTHRQIKEEVLHRQGG